MNLQNLRMKLNGGSFADLISSKKKGEQRIISDIEFLDDQQYEFLEQHTQQQFFSFMQQYWGEKMIAAQITCRTMDGEVINVDRGSIRVIDKRWKGASHCICGKAIRYEYWIGTYGPIGSVHIVDHTNLDKTFVRDLTKGYKTQNELRTEIVHLLADLKEQGKTYEDWASSFDYESKMQNVEKVRNPERRELIKRLYGLHLPLPEKLRHELNYVQQSLTPSMNLPHNSSTISTSTLSVSSNPHQALITRIEKALQDYQAGNHQGISEYHLRTLNNLLETIFKGKPSTNQLAYAQNLVAQVEKSCGQNVPGEWNKAQQVAKQLLFIIDTSAPKNSFVQSLYSESQSSDLTERQLDCIFSSTKKHQSLFDQYASLMQQFQIEAVDPSSYR